jgi:hypothetical protein
VVFRDTFEIDEAAVRDAALVVRAEQRAVELAALGRAVSLLEAEVDAAAATVRREERALDRAQADRFVGWFVFRVHVRPDPEEVRRAIAAVEQARVAHEQRVDALALALAHRDGLERRIGEAPPRGERPAPVLARATRRAEADAARAALDLGRQLGAMTAEAHGMAREARRVVLVAALTGSASLMTERPQNELIRARAALLRVRAQAFLVEASLGPLPADRAGAGRELIARVLERASAIGGAPTQEWQDAVDALAAAVGPVAQALEELVTATPSA